MDKFDVENLVQFDAPSTFKAEKILSTSDEPSPAKANVPSQTHYSLAKMQQKENQSNRQEITKTNMEYKLDDIRMGQSLCKVQSLSSMRDVGCTNPMAYTLLHHPTFTGLDQIIKQEETFSSLSNLDTTHEESDVVNNLVSSDYNVRSKAMLTPITISSDPQYDKNDVDNDDDHDDVDDDWNTGSPVFVPVSTTWTDGMIAATSTKGTMDRMLKDIVVGTSIIDLKKSNSFGNDNPRRHSLPEYISRPIARRPLSTTSMSSSLSLELQNIIK